jgi:hypothetical protein
MIMHEMHLYIYIYGSHVRTIFVHGTFSSRSSQGGSGVGHICLHSKSGCKHRYHRSTMEQHVNPRKSDRDAATFTIYICMMYLSTCTVTRARFIDALARFDGKFKRCGLEA